MGFFKSSLIADVVQEVVFLGGYPIVVIGVNIAVLAHAAGVESMLFIQGIDIFLPEEYYVSVNVKEGGFRVCFAIFVVGQTFSFANFGDNIVDA